MRIAIEAQRIFRPDKHGMDFVALETIRELQKMDNTNEYFIFVSPGEDHCLTESSNLHIIEIHCPTYPLWEQVALPFAVSKIKADILHCTSNTAPVFCPVPLILTLHDIFFLEEKEGENQSLYQSMGWYYRRWIVPIIVNKCRHIITVSHIECDRIVSKLKLDLQKISVIHNGFSKQYHPITESYTVTQKYCNHRGYLLFLGNTDPRKNTPRILLAYHSYLQQSNIKRPLIITGLKNEQINILLSKLQIEDIKPYILSPGYISGEDLPYLYNGAFALLNVSLKEGFGIPILEAMACGIPVITGNTSAMPEVAGEDGVLVNPLDIDAITGKILQLENDRDFYNQQVNYGLQRVKCFSWKKTAQTLLALYQSIKSTKL